MDNSKKKSNKQFPSSVTFLLADDIREEIGNKKSLIGMYVGDAIQISEPTIPPLIMPSLLIFILLRGGSGTFNATFKVIAPGRQNMLTSEPAEVTLIPNVNFVFANKVNGFPIPEFGDYEIQLKLDTKTFKYKFKVMLSQQE